MFDFDGANIGLVFYRGVQIDVKRFVFAFGDAFRDADGTSGADEAAQVATHALVAHEVRLAVVAEGDGLMAAVHTGNIASATADAALTIEDGEDHGVAVQIVGFREIRQLLTHQGRELSDASAGHIVLKAQLEVIDDAVAILHHGSAHLQVAATQLNELDRVLPSLDAADTTHLQVLEHRVQGHLKDEALGDGLDGASRESRHTPRT